MAKDHDKSLGDQNTFDGGVKRVESSQQSLGDQSTFGGGDASSMAELDGLVGGAGLDIVGSIYSAQLFSRDFKSLPADLTPNVSQGKIR